MLDVFLYYIMEAAAVGVVACLISESNAFHWFREAFDFDLFYCPICLGFWIALPVLFTSGVLQYFTVVAISNVWMLVILKVYRELDESDDDADSEV